MDAAKQIFIGAHYRHEMQLPHEPSYRVVGVGMFKVSNTSPLAGVDGETIVIYENVSGAVFARPRSDFLRRFSHAPEPPAATDDNPTHGRAADAAGCPYLAGEGWD